jgi:uncharacterized LabA/DUF88 family protein
MVTMGEELIETLRVVVFIDYQNMYRSAREAFGWTQERGFMGNFRPLRLGRGLAAGQGRRLTQARVYTGVPAPERDGIGHAIMQRRLAAWKAEAPELVEVLSRSLRYPPREGREKGVDVQLAVDFVRLAIEGTYDVAALASADTDLLPALEFVIAHFPEKQIETMSWQAAPEATEDVAAPLDVPGGQVRRRLLARDDFSKVEDTTNYSQKAQSAGPAPGQSGRELPPGRR